MLTSMDWTLVVRVPAFATKQLPALPAVPKRRQVTGAKLKIAIRTLIVMSTRLVGQQTVGKLGRILVAPRANALAAVCTLTPSFKACAADASMRKQGLGARLHLAYIESPARSIAPGGRAKEGPADIAALKLATAIIGHCRLAAIALELVESVRPQPRLQLDLGKMDIRQRFH